MHIITPPQLPDHFLAIGHRGLPGVPRKGENTIESFKGAVKSGANAIEYDLRRTKDGKIVVFHDRTLERITGMPGALADYTYEELSALDAGYGRRIPLFEEVLRQIGARAAYNIELKETGLSEEVLGLIVKYEMQEHAFVSAFDSRDDFGKDAGTSTWDDLAIFPKNGIPVALLAGTDKIDRTGEDGFVAAAIARHASAINPPFTSVTQSLVDLAHAKGLKVYVYTVNEPADIRRMIALGVDGIFSDDVSRVLAEEMGESVASPFQDTVSEAV